MVQELPPFGIISSSIGDFTTVMNTRVNVFVFPADGATSRWPGAVSYRGSLGVGPNANHHYEFLIVETFFLPTSMSIKLREHVSRRFPMAYRVPRCFSERLVGAGASVAHDPQRDFRLSDVFLSRPELARS